MPTTTDTLAETLYESDKIECEIRDLEKQLQLKKDKLKQLEETLKNYSK